MANNHAPTRGLGITLDQTFESNLGPNGVRSYVETLLGLHREAANLSDVEGALRERTDQIGVRLPEFSYKRLAEQLVMTPVGELTIRNSFGQVLAGPEADQAHAEPDVDGAEDPENGSRPFYS